MRVLALESEPSGTRGGQEHSLLDVCAGLASAGHAVTLAHLEEGDLLPRYAAAGIQTLKVGAYAVDRGRLFTSTAEVAASLVRAIRVRPDVVYINQYHDSLFAAMVARLLRIPLVCHLRLFPPESFCGQWRIGLTGVSRFIAVSEATRQAYVERGFDPGAVDLVVNGIDVDRFRTLPDKNAIRNSLGLSEDEFVTLFVGRIDPGKNLEGLLASFARLRETIPKARLLVAGRPLNHGSVSAGVEYLARLRAVAAELGVDDGVSWLGPRTDAVQLYNAADVCVLPSKHPETFGRILAEAMACGTPGIGTAIGGVPEVLIQEASRFLVPPADVSALTAKLREVAESRGRDPDLGARLRRITVENFNSRRMVREVAAVLENAVLEGAVRRGPRILAA